MEEVVKLVKFLQSGIFSLVIGSTVFAAQQGIEKEPDIVSVQSKDITAKKKEIFTNNILKKAAIINVLKKTAGILCISAFSAYVSCDNRPPITSSYFDNHSQEDNLAIQINTGNAHDYYNDPLRITNAIIPEDVKSFNLNDITQCLFEVDITSCDFISFVVDESDFVEAAKKAEEFAGANKEYKALIIEVLKRRFKTPEEAEDKLFELSEKRILNSFALTALQAAGADINKMNKYKETPLILATKKIYVEIVRMLIDAGADLDKQDSDDFTALMWAAWRKNPEYRKILRMLIDNGANLNLKDNGGDTALIWAANAEHKEAVTMLIDAGADINIQNVNGNTALIWAVYRGNSEIAQMLINAEADINIQDADGNTALLWALIKMWNEDNHPLIQVTKSKKAEYEKIIQMLIDNGADLNTKNEKGTALIWAVNGGYKEVVKMLIDGGADVNIPGRDGITALMWAVDKGNLEIVKMLIDAKADPII